MLKFTKMIFVIFINDQNDGSSFKYLVLKFNLFYTTKSYP